MAYAKIDIYAPTEKPKQESVWRGPLDVIRTQTDFKFFIALVICFAIWIAIGIYAICAGDRNIALFSNALGHLELYREFRHIYNFIDESKYYIFIFTLESIAILSINVLMFRWLTRLFVVLTLLLLFVLITILYVFSLFLIINWDIGYPILTTGVVISVFYALTFYAFYKAGMNMVCKLLKQSCKALLFFPSTMIVMITQIVVQVLLICFGGAVFTFLLTIKDQTEEEAGNSTLGLPDRGENASVTDNDILFYYYGIFRVEHYGTVPAYVYLFHIINFVGYFWSCCFVMGLGRMVLGATFATWYHVEDKSKIPTTTMPKCFMAILKHHLGTIAFAASPLSIFIVLYVIFTEGMDKLKRVFKRPLYILSWLLAMIKLPFDALAMSAIHGKEFYYSSRDAYNLLMTNPIAFLAIDTLSENIIFFGTILTPILSVISTVMYFVYGGHDHIGDVAPVTTTVVFTISLIMSLTLFMVFGAASNTIRFCYLEDSKFSHESEMNLYQIQANERDTDF